MIQVELKYGRVDRVTARGDRKVKRDEERERERERERVI